MRKNSQYATARDTFDIDALVAEVSRDERRAPSLAANDLMPLTGRRVQHRHAA